MFQPATVVEKQSQDRKTRENQRLEFLKILQEDQLPAGLAQTLAEELENEAFLLSNGDQTREYRTRVNTVKMRMKGTKGKLIRDVLRDKIMTPRELMSLDMGKLSEDSVQAYLRQNNKSVPQPNQPSALRRFQPPATSTSRPPSTMPPPPVRQVAQPPSNLPPANPPQGPFGFQTEEEKGQPDNATVLQQPEPHQQPLPTFFIQQADTGADEKNVSQKDIDFSPPKQETPMNFEEIADYSGEYQSQQKDFVEGNDFPNIQELQKNQELLNDMIKEGNNLESSEEQQDQQNSQDANYSPLPSDNLLNQEFMQESSHEEGKAGILSQNQIFDKQNGEADQPYLEHSFTANNEKAQDEYEQQQSFDNQLQGREELSAPENQQWGDQQNQNQNQNQIEPVNEIVSKYQQQELENEGLGMISEQPTQNVHSYEKQFANTVHPQPSPQFQYEQNSRRLIRREFDFQGLQFDQQQFDQLLESREKIYQSQILSLSQTNEEMQQNYLKLEQQTHQSYQQLNQNYISLQSEYQQLQIEHNHLQQTISHQENTYNKQIQQLKDQLVHERTAFAQKEAALLTQVAETRRLLQSSRQHESVRKEWMNKIVQTQKNGAIVFDDQISQMQSLLLKIQTPVLPRIFTQTLTSEPQSKHQSQIHNTQQFNANYATTNQFWANEEDLTIQNTQINADSGSTQLKNQTNQAFQQEGLEEEEFLASQGRTQQSGELQQFIPQQTLQQSQQQHPTNQTQVAQITQFQQQQVPQQPHVNQSHAQPQQQQSQPQNQTQALPQNQQQASLQNYFQPQGQHQHQQQHQQQQQQQQQPHQQQQQQQSQLFSTNTPSQQIQQQATPAPTIGNGSNLGHGETSTQARRKVVAQKPTQGSPKSIIQSESETQETPLDFFNLKAQNAEILEDVRQMESIPPPQKKDVKSSHSSQPQPSDKFGHPLVVHRHQNHHPEKPQRQVLQSNPFANQAANGQEEESENFFFTTQQQQQSEIEVKPKKQSQPPSQAPVQNQSRPNTRRAQVPGALFD